MHLYIGGKAQGKRAYVEMAEGSGADIISDYQEVIRRQLQQQQDPIRCLKDLLSEKPDVVIICDEVGYGVVPVEKEEREFREAVGRTMCEAAQAAQTVVRIVCGIGQKIK
ncbi:bifunctional adenosylcobinamide kinase/adenosylcobinamide-phosphate guanylyltransferase [Diplocloster hominis]|uniref:bifunctional adenosylcobinamide kinase/adenosylcobinamide-phosphate guanylyltransferase n=1 Tax=Diplocloster hominis TaxID=3079010 RepID=UPI0031BA8798